MMRFAFIILLIVTHSVNLFSGTFRHLSVKDGLSSRQVFRINKDSIGYIWIFTHLGVDRYDGNEIRHYKLDETLEAKDHILSSTIMTCDQQGNLWVMLKNGNIYSYDRQTDTFIRRINLTQSLSQPAMLNDMLFSRDGSLWLCLTTGIYQYDLKEGLLIPAGLSGECMNRIVEANDGSFFAGTNTHIYHLRRQSGGKLFSSTDQMQFPIQARVESLYIFQDKLYVGTFSDGAFVMSLSDGEVTSFNRFIPSVPIRSIVSGGDNSILIATDGSGVYKLDASNGSLLSRYITGEDNEGSLSGNTVSDLCVDERGCIWISTYTNGISYLDPDSPHLNWVRHGYNNQNSLSSSHVNVVLEDSEGDLWYGTNNGVSLYRTQTKKWTHFLADAGDKLTHSSVVITLCEDKRQDIWVGGYGIGVYRINKHTGRVQRMKSQANDGKDGMSTKYVYSIYAEGDDVWLGGIEGNFTRYNILTGAYTYYPIRCIGDIQRGSDGKLLLAGCDGLGIFDPTDGSVVWHRTFGNLTLSYPIRSLLRASTGDIWLATDGEGLIRFHPETNQSDLFTVADGLISNAIVSLAEDEMGRIWFNTEQNLYCLDVTQRKLISMNEFFDISWGYYNPNASVRLRNGDLAFGTGEGALIFSPSFDFEQGGSVKLIFTDLKLLYQSVKAGEEGSLLKQAINETSAVRLEYVQNSFSISFSSIDFVYPHQIRYEYTLENFNEEWQKTNTIQRIDYMNLSPGNYVFRLRAVDKYTHEILDERSLDITIDRPFWISYPALLVYFIFLCALVYLLIQFGRHKIFEYNSREKIRTFIHIAHDIRTPITLIKAPLSELEAQEELPEHSRKSLGVAVKNAEKLFTMVTQLLDLQKTDLHPERLIATRQDIYSYMEEKITDFRMAAIQKGLDLRLDIEPDFPEVCFDKSKMNKIMDNLLSNALKYTEEGSITVMVRQSRRKWTVEILDTGIGIPAKEQKLLFNQFFRAGNAVETDEIGSGIGLLLTRRMVKLHRGQISFSSAVNAGTSFVLTFPKKMKISTVAEREPETAPLQREKPVLFSTARNTLLLAEDDDDMREYLTDSLSQEYEVISVTDGGKALELAREINPDIIISDVIMPVLQGDEMCRLLKSSIDTSHIPIILLTAMSERENIIHGLEAGANDYIIKPFDFSVLKVRIRNILQSRQHLRETVLSSEANLIEIDYNNQLDKEFLCKAMEIINAELADPEFSINDFCRSLGMSRTSVYNKVKTLTDQSPNDFIRIIRLNKSKELLLSKKFTIGEVSCMVGFSDPKYFSTCFKKQFGISPSKI